MTTARLAVFDVALLALCACAAQIIASFAAHRGLPVPLAWLLGIVVLVATFGGYAKQALPWWRHRLHRP